MRFGFLPSLKPLPTMERDREAEEEENRGVQGASCAPPRSHRTRNMEWIR